MAVLGRFGLAVRRWFLSIVIHSADRGVTQVGELDNRNFWLTAFLPTQTSVQAEAVRDADRELRLYTERIAFAQVGDRVVVDTMSADLSRITAVQFPGGAVRVRAYLRGPASVRWLPIIRLVSPRPVLSVEGRSVT